MLNRRQLIQSTSLGALALALPVSASPAPRPNWSMIVGSRSSKTTLGARLAMQHQSPSFLSHDTTSIDAMWNVARKWFVNGHSRITLLYGHDLQSMLERLRLRPNSLSRDFLWIDERAEHTGLLPEVASYFKEVLWTVEYPSDEAMFSEFHTKCADMDTVQFCWGAAA